jgi:hypothetical protein
VGDRRGAAQIKLWSAQVKDLRRQINSEWIYLPCADRAKIFAANPANLVA